MIFVFPCAGGTINKNTTRVASSRRWFISFTSLLPEAHHPVVFCRRVSFAPSEGIVHVRILDTAVCPGPYIVLYTISSPYPKKMLLSGGGRYDCRRRWRSRSRLYVRDELLSSPSDTRPDHRSKDDGSSRWWLVSRYMIIVIINNNTAVIHQTSSDVAFRSGHFVDIILYWANAPFVTFSFSG